MDPLTLKHLHNGKEKQPHRRGDQSLSPHFPIEAYNPTMSLRQSQKGSPYRVGGNPVQLMKREEIGSTYDSGNILSKRLSQPYNHSQNHTLDLSPSEQ